MDANDATERRRRARWRAGTLVPAAGCLALAAAVPTARWAAFFAGPRVVDDVGAAVWRLMLVVLAAALVAVSFTLPRLAPGRPGPESDRRPLGAAAWIVAGLIVIALLGRATRLGECLWYDEIAAWREYGQLGPGPIVGTYFDPSNHVAHTLLSWVSMQGLESALGGALALRVPALLASLLAVPLMYSVARAALDRRGALFAAAATAVLPVAVLEGADARADSLMVCLAAAATATLLAAWRRRTPSSWCLYAAVCALGAWAHPVAVFVPAGHALWLGAAMVRGPRRRDAAAGAVALGLAAVGTLTLYAPILPSMLRLRGILASRDDAQPALFGAEGLYMLWQTGGAWAWWAALPGLALVVIGLATGWRRPRLRRVVILGWAGWGLFLVAILVTGSWFYARFTLFALPGAIVLMAAGAGGLSRRSRWPAVAALVVLVAASVADLATRPPRQPLRDAADHIRASGGRGAAVIVLGLRHRVFDVYGEDLRLVYSVPHGADLDRVLAADDAPWLVLYHPRHVSADTRDLIRAAGFTRQQRYPGWIDWDNGDVEVWKRGIGH